ncbi:ankyrin-2-like isoform X14 [Centruroides vittatus]|uniref:ankyrin-2-like isoform X14 n=1 Tax=Centruroides vittatus TaxID=120091 RepID=UPI00350ED79C
MEEKGRRSRRDVLTDGNSSFLRAARAGNLDKVLEWLKGSIDINTSNANGLNALHLASKEGHINVVTELIKRGANVNAATKKGNTALHISSLAGKQEVVKILVQNGANVNVQSQNGFTPLYMAAQENHDDVLSFLLANGANQSLSTEDGFTPLAVALQQGHDKVVTILLENDTKGKVRLPALHIAAKKDDCKAATLLLQSDHNPDVTSKSGFTPLHIAAHYGNENIAMILLEKGADVNFTAKHQITPLHVAAKWGKSNMVALLLEKGAKIGASTRDGLTPLHCAARSGHETVVDQLLENGAPISAKTKNGLAPLHMSSQGDHVDSARILLYHKAPVDDVTVDYLTALHVAAHCGHVNVAKLLLDRNADPNARALNGFTPLHIACKKNRIKVVELLLKHGASIEATTESGLTPLHVASFMGCMNIVIFLLQNGANPDVPTVRGETPLHLAARANQTDIIRILLRNGAHVDAPAREEQTPLHIAARLGNVDIVSLLLQHGAAVDATTKDMYTALHVAAKEGQEEVASVLLDHGASLTAATKKGFTPLHMAAKYGNIKVARLLLHKDAPVDAQGKNGVTPLHVAAHYDHVNVALLLLDKGASPHATAKNGYTPLHIASKKNQMDISTTLLEYGAKANTESKAGFTSLHLAAQEGHTDMATLLIEHNADVNARAKNGLTPLHLCAQEDRVNVAEILVKNGAEIDPQTKAEYSPLHVACHFGQINMVRFLLQHGANVNSTTSYGYTPLHQAAQQGHNLIINLLLENQASPNIVSTQGQTPLSIAQRLGYISVVETLKVVTETVVTTTTTTVIEEKYKVVAPETMQETFMSDSEDDGGEETMLGDQSYRYLTADEMKSLGDDSLPIDVTKDERPTESMMLMKESSAAPLTIEEDHLSPQHSQMIESALYGSYSPDNVDISLTSVAPISAGRLKWKTFLVSFMVDARGGAMRGCRHSGVRVIIPPRKASMPMRITCRYLRKEKLAHPPPLMEGEACASRILEVGPVGARFLGPVIIEVPHFASLRGKEREITILRSDNGETWRDHTLEASEEAVQEVLSDSFDGEELSALEDLNTNRITRILTTDFPQYFAIITRIRQEVHAIGPEGGMVTSTVVPQVQAIFPEGALTKKIKVGLQAQPIQPDLVTKLLGNSVAVSPIVTVEPRRRKFHKPITLTIPVPQAATKGMINQYSGDAPTLRLLCSITGSSKSGGSSKAQWEDVTGSTPLTLVNECISFTTTVSARFWLMDCRQVNEATKFATELYQEVIHVPFMGKFVIFAKRYDTLEAQLRVFCMTDDKEDKTLESQEHFTEIAKSRDVEVLQNKPQYLEFAGNLVPITKSGDQLFLTFHAFRENRLPFSIRIKDPLQEPMGRIAFMKEPKVGRGEPQPVPICNLNIALPEVCKMDNISELVTLEKKYCFVQETGLAKPELIHRADLRLSDIARELDGDWEILALQLDISETEINSIKSDYPDDDRQQALIMLRQWMQKSGPKATGNSLEKALRKIRRDDIVKQCMFNVELVTDAVEKAVAKVHLDQSGFDTFKEELGSSRDASLRREVSLDVSYDEQDLIKETVHMTENGAEIIEKQIVSDEFVKEPAQAAKITQDQREEKAVKYISSVTVETQEVIRENVVKQGATETATTIVMEGEEVSEHDVHDHTAKLVESETWASEMDTSQVSISSLPEDEKSEPTTATISSSIAAEPESAAAEASTEEKEHDLEKQVIPSDQDDSSSQDRTIEEQISEEKQVMEDLVASTLPSVTKETLELALTKRFDENLKTSVVQKKMISDEKVTDISISANKEDIYKITKEKEIISDERKQEEKSPQHVDRGLSPIAVYTAYPGDIRREGSEFFIKTYDAPTMQEPVTSYLGKSIKENIIRSKSISINEDTRPLEILLDRKILDMDEGRATSESKLTLVNPPITKTLDIHFKTESHIRITHRTKDEKEELSPEHISLPSDKNMVTEIENLPSSPVLQTDQASSPINIESPLKTEIIKSPSLTEEDISKGIGLQESFELSEEIYEKSEIATSPMSDHLLDTGVGTESPVTTETASSPFQFETKSVAVSPHDSAADISFPKEDSSTQTTLVDTVSAHTSPMDLSLSFQDALLDQQIQLGVADIESQDEIETPGTEILDDEELEDKFAQESLPETKEQALALKSEAISTQEKLKLMKQNDFERSKDVKLIQTYKFVTTQRKDVDSIDKSIKQETVLKCGKKVFTTFIKEEKVKTDWSEIEDKNVQSKTVEGATSQETEVSVVPEVQGRPSELQGICSTIEPGTVHRTREIDIAAGIEELDEAQMKQLTPEEILSFAEKRDFFQRLSQTSIILPPDFSSSTKLTMTKGVKLIDESDARQGEVVEEQVSFAERLKFFQTGAEDENGSKPSSITGDSSALSDEGTEAERSITEKEFAEDKISGLKEKSSSSSEFTSENQVLKAEIQLFLRTGSGGEAIEISKIKDYSGLRKEASQESYVSEEEKQEVLETNLATYAAEETQINEEWEIINDDEIREARETLHLHIDKDKGIEETWEVFSKQKQELKSVEISPQITSETEEKEIEKTITELTTVVETTEFIKEKLKDDLIKSETKDEMKVEETMKTKGDTTLIMQKETTDSVEEKVKEDLVKSETEDEIKLEEITKTEGDTTLIMQKETTESFEEKVKEDLIQSENKEDIKVEGDTTLIIQKEMFYPQEEIDISYTLESEPLVKTEIKEKEIKVSSSEEIEDVCGETETKETVTKTIVRNIEKTIIRTVTNIKSGSNLETVKVAETESCIDDNTSKDLNTSDEIKFKEPLSKEITVPEKEITTEISPQENLDVSTKRTIIIEKKLNSKSNVISLVEKEEKILDISEIEKELKRDSPEKQIITQTGDELMYDDSDKKHIDFIQDEQYEYEGKLIPEVHPEIPSDLTKEDIEIETDSEFKMMQPLKSEDISHETKDTELEAEEEILKSASEIMDSTVTSLPLSHDESEDTEDDQKKSEHMVFESDTATKDTTESESESKDSLSNISVMEKADTIHLQALELEEEAVSHKESDISQLEMTELTDSKHLINKEYEMMESLASAEAFPVAITSTVVTEGNEIATTDQSTVIVRKISTIVSKTENVILEREYKKVKSDKTYKERLFDTDTDYIYSGKEEIKKESEDQFEVPMKKTEEKEIGIITTDKTTELLEEQTIDTYASPLVKEFQEEEKSEKFQKDKISDISISQSSKVEQYLESRTSEEYNIDLDTEILSKEEKDSSEVVKSLSEIEDKFIESLRVTEEIEIPEPIPDLTVKETTVEEVPEEKITEKQSITEILDSSDYEIKSEIVTITEQCSTKDIIHDAKFDDDSKKLKEEKAKIVEFIEPLSEIKKTEEIQYSKSLPSEVIDKTELLSDDGKKKSVEELIHSKSEMKETLIKETGATESTLLSYDVKTEISKLQEEESVIESIPDITIPESAPCITKQENFEDIKKQDEQKEETAVIDDIMPESTQHEFIDVSDLEDIEPELEIKAQPIVTTPVIERKLKTDRTQRKTHISVADVTEKYADTEVKHTEPIIFEPSDDDKESFGIECHHSTPDFRQMTDIDLEAILEEHAKEEQRRAASESIDTEEHDLTLLDKKEPEDLSVKSPIDIHSPISQSMPPISPPISLPKLDESECHSILSTDIDSCADIKTSHSKSESPLIPDVVDEKIEEQKLISENEYSDQEVFYAEPSSDITDAVQKTTDETSQSSIICEPESEAQIKYRTQMAFDNTAFMGIDNIDVGEAVNREMVRSPYEVVRMKFEDFEIGMTTEQSSVVPEEQVLSEEKISKLEIKEDKYESESVDKSLEIPSREEATKIAQEIIEEIRTEVAKSPLLQNASIKIPDEDDIKTDSQIFASDDKEIMPDMIQSDDGKLIPGEEIFPAEIETSTTKTDEIKPDDKIKELSYEKADETTFPTSKTFQLTKESMEIKESHIFITNGKIEAISSDVDLITDEYDNRQFPVSEEIDYTEDFHSQMSYIGKQDTSTKSVKETESFTSHANLNGPVAVSYIPEYDDETFTIEKIKETDVIDVTKDTFYDISQKSARQDIPESDLMHSENIENAFEESVSASDIKETEIFNEEEYIRTRISISDDQVDQEIKKILSDESQTEDDRLTDIIERPITPEPSDEILEEMLLPESEQLSKLATITQKTISISEEEICVKHTESEMIYPHQNVFSESETDEPTDITVNKFYETALTVDLESREGFPTESVFQQESAEIMEEAMDIGSDKCSDDIEETDNKTHFEYGVHFAAEPHYDEIPKYVESGYGDLYTHQEEDEEIFDEDLQESKNLIENNKQMFSDLDVLLGPKLYTKSGEHDDSSMSSLQEFERLEAEIATGRKLSQGSVDSLNGRPSISKSGEHDDVSMNSLTEFERLERECAEAERIESVAREEAARLSEIEEGHESQASETSQETLSGPEDMDSIDSDDYEKRLSEIDEIIRQAQTNVESFQVEPMPKQSLKSIRKTEIKSLSESLEKDIRPIDQIPSPTPKEQDSDSLDGNLNNIVLMQKETKELDICITELTPAKSSLTVESHDANEDSLNEDQDNSLEHDSLHEVKDHEQDSLKEDKTGDVDSLQEDQKILMQDSLYEEKDLDEDSLRESLELPKDELDVSQLSDKGIDTVEFDDSLHEECIASSKYLEHEPKFIPSLISSTDSLEPSSSTAATHATYQFETDSIMSSSLNSIQTSGEETLMASSTDSLDPNRMMQAYRNVVDSQLRRDTQDMYLDYEGNVQSAPDQTKSYMDKEGNIHPVSEIVKKLDVTNQTCVLNVSEEDQNIIDSIEESKTIKSLKDDTTSSKEYVSLDTTRIQSNVVTKDLSLTLTKDDVQDEEIDEEGNIIEKGKSPDVMHDSDEDDKDQTSISEDSLQKQVEDRFSDTKVISSRKGGEQVEEIKTVDELGNIRIIRRIRHIVTVQRDELSNPDIEKSEQAEPEVEETRTTDDKGNVKIIRRSRRIIKMPDSQSSDIDKHLQEFVQKSSVSDDSQITSPDVSQTDSLQEKYFQDPRCESPITRDMLSGRESVASIRSDFSDADSEIREIKTTDEKGNIIIRRIRRIVTPLPPDSNPSSGRESPYLKEPSETVEERRTVDEKGNVIIKRIRRIVKVQTKDTSETSPIPLVDNEELAKSDTACEESEPEECKFVDEDGNIKHIRRIKKIIKIPQTSNDEEALINDLLQKSEISDSISESSETFYKSDSKLINHVDHGGEETEKHLVQVKKSSSDDTQEPSIEEKFKDFLKKSIAQDSKDEKHEERIIDDKGNVVIIRTVKTSKVSEPKIHSQKFTGPDAEKQSLEFIKSFDTLHSTSQLQQYEATDGEGNIVRVTQEISAQPHVHSVSFSGESYEQDMESYMKNYEEKMHSSEPGSSPSISKSPTSVSNINVPYSTMKTTTHSVDESPIHTLSGTVSSSDTLPIHHEETKLMSEEIDNKELVQSYDSDDAIDSEEDEIIDYLKRGTSSFKEVEPPSDSKNGYSEESAKQL